MKKAVYALIAAFVAWACLGPMHQAFAEGRPALTVMVLPFNLSADIITSERSSRDEWPLRKARYDAIILSASELLKRGIAGAGHFRVVEGSLPEMPHGQQGPGRGAVSWPFLHAGIMAGADALLMCDITRMEFTERTSHYLFEIYSVHTYRMTASIDVKLVDIRAERILKSAIISGSATHRVHRLFWDSIWIHRYTTGPDLAEKLMETLSEKIIRAIR